MFPLCSENERRMVASRSNEKRKKKKLGCGTRDYVSFSWMERCIGLLASNVGVFLIVYSLFTCVMALEVVGKDHFFNFS